MKLTKQQIAIAAVVVVVALLGVWYFNSDAYAQKRFEKEVLQLTPEAQAEVNDFVAKATERIEVSRADSTDLTGWIDAARFWKMVATVHGLDYGYEQAIDIYEEAIASQGEGNALLNSAAAGTYKAIGDHDTARTYYERAMSLEPGNAQRYNDLATHIRYNFPDEPVEVVLAIYEEGLSRVVFGGDAILRDRARYYEDVAGDKVNAYQDWSRLLVIFPGDAPIASEVLRLREELTAEGVEFEEVPSN